MSQQSNENIDGISPQASFDYVFRLFLYHADQRMKSFNFYIILLIASVGGTLTAFEKLLTGKMPEYYNVLSLIGACHIILALIFWAIDIRGKRLVEVSRKALIVYEKSSAWRAEFLSPMGADDAQQAGCRGFISMTNAFRCAFSLHIVFGAALMFWRWL